MKVDDYDYVSIGAKVREAKRLRDEAAGRLLAEAWLAVKRAAKAAMPAVRTNTKRLERAAESSV